MKGPIRRGKSVRIEPAAAAGASPAPVPRHPAGADAALPPLFRYIWQQSRREQILILLVVLASLPFYFASLDLPKTIVNDAIQGRAFAGGKDHAVLFRIDPALPGWLGGRHLAFSGIEFGRYEYLFALSGLFMVLVLINAAFRYVVNMRKGKLGEAVLRRLRLDLFSLLLRFTPEAIRNVKASEAATIIKDEVEPIGGFVGDAFVQPVFLGGQALTALLFIIVQSPSLGVLAGAMVGVQGFIIPRLRREQRRLGRERQLHSRALAGHIGEIVDGMAEVSNHGTSAYERHKISAALDRLFRIRYELYGRKFMVKFINSVLAQVTPFLFYSIGGYYALRGSLDIGQLVAVIAAYRDLPPPVKELIDWDQQRLDVEVKYQQIVEQFASARPEAGGQAPDGISLTCGAIELKGLRVTGAGGEVLLDGVNASIPLGAHTVLLGTAGDGASTLAQVIGRRLTAYAGSVLIAGHDFAALAGPGMAYCGPDAVLFQGSIRDNILYGLRRPQAPLQADGPLGAAPIDYAAAGAAGPEDVDTAIVAALHAVGMADAIYRFGLGRTLDPDGNPEVADRFVAARRALSRALAAEHVADLIEPFDPDRFNRNATLGENLVFGIVRQGGGELADHPAVQAVLDAEDLAQPLVQVGLRIAGTMTEALADLPDDHFLLKTYALVPAGDLPLLRDILARWTEAGRTPPAADRRRLVGLAFAYCETRHRLGLVTPDLAARVLRARATFMRSAPPDLKAAIDFYDPQRLNATAPLRDNLLFGRINHGIAGAVERILAILRRVVRDNGLETEIYRIGLDQQVGLGGRLLSPALRNAVGLARCLVKSPDLLVLDQPLLVFGAEEGRRILARVRAAMGGKTLLAALSDPALADGFDFAVTLDGARMTSAAAPTGAAPASPPEPAEQAADEQPEIRALRAVPMFAAIDTPRLKLISLASEHLSFARGQTLFDQGAPSDAAYVILSGTAEVFAETAAGRRLLSRIPAHAVVGEMGVITGAARSATVVAASDLTALSLSKDAFLGLLADVPPMAIAVMRDQIGRLLRAEARLPPPR